MRLSVGIAFVLEYDIISVLVCICRSKPEHSQTLLRKVSKFMEGNRESATYRRKVLVDLLDLTVNDSELELMNLSGGGDNSIAFLDGTLWLPVKVRASHFKSSRKQSRPKQVHRRERAELGAHCWVCEWALNCGGSTGAELQPANE